MIGHISCHSGPHPSQSQVGRSSPCCRHHSISKRSFEAANFNKQNVNCWNLANELQVLEIEDGNHKSCSRPYITPLSRVRQAFHFKLHLAKGVSAIQPLDGKDHVRSTITMCSALYTLSATRPAQLSQPSASTSLVSQHHLRVAQHLRSFRRLPLASPSTRLDRQR